MVRALGFGFKLFCTQEDKTKCKFQSREVHMYYSYVLKTLDGEWRGGGEGTWRVDKEHNKKSGTKTPHTEGEASQ